MKCLFIRAYAYAAMCHVSEWLTVRQCHMFYWFMKEHSEENLGAGTGLCFPKGQCHSGLGVKGREDCPCCFQDAQPLEPWPLRIDPESGSWVSPSFPPALLECKYSGQKLCPWMKWILVYTLENSLIHWCLSFVILKWWSDYLTWLGNQDKSVR